MEILANSIRESSLLQEIGHPLNDGRRLRRRLQDDTAACKQSRDERVDENEVGVLGSVSGTLRAIL